MIRVIIHGPGEACEWGTIPGSPTDHTSALAACDQYIAQQNSPARPKKR